MDTPDNHTEPQNLEEQSIARPNHGMLNARRSSSRAVSIERRSGNNTVFHVDDTPFQSTTPAATHWSVAWSDLMMTMFILFLSMFVYQMAHDDFLEPTRQEIIGGNTTEALESTDSSGASFPFAPISPSLPLMTAGTIKKVESVPRQELKKELPSVIEEKVVEMERPIEEYKSNLSPQITMDDKIAIIVEKDKGTAPQLSPSPLPIPSDTVLEPRPLIPEESKVQQNSPTSDPIQDIYRLSEDALKKNDLEKFATLDLVPDKTMRIILTGDLLFSLGNSDLSASAKESLYTLANVLKETPYMINVVGHTDNIPMTSNKFRSNWELSVARASGVARFLIDNIGMDPTQFVVSGYASYRPVVPNNSSQNRAKNRRVEIIISKRLPKPQPVTSNNLN